MKTTAVAEFHLGVFHTVTGYTWLTYNYQVALHSDAVLFCADGIHWQYRYKRDFFGKLLSKHKPVKRLNPYLDASFGGVK